MEWRTNKKTRRPFPVAVMENTRWLEGESEDVNEAPLDGDSVEIMVCSFCGKEFVGQGYYLTDETGDSGVACSNCNRTDNKIAREDARLAASSSGDNFVGSRGGSGWKCPNCGKTYYNYTETDKQLHIAADSKYGV